MEEASIPTDKTGLLKTAFISAVSSPLLTCRKKKKEEKKIIRKKTMKKDRNQH